MGDAFSVPFIFSCLSSIRTAVKSPNPAPRRIFELQLAYQYRSFKRWMCWSMFVISKQNMQFLNNHRQGDNTQNASFLILSLSLYIFCKVSKQ